MNHREIIQQLEDSSRVFRTLETFPAAVMMELNREWQWNEESGLPVFEDTTHRKY